jgi:hypothetical protein
MPQRGIKRSRHGSAHAHPRADETLRVDVRRPLGKNVNAISSRGDFQVHIGRGTRRDRANDAGDFHSLAVFQSGGQLIERNRFGSGKRRGAENSPRRPRNDRREGARLAHSLYLDQVAGFRRIVGAIFHENAAGRVLNKKLAAPGRLGGRNDSPNDHGDFLASLILREGKHLGGIGQNRARSLGAKAQTGAGKEGNDCRKKDPEREGFSGFGRPAHS